MNNLLITGIGHLWLTCTVIFILHNLIDRRAWKEPGAHLHLPALALLGPLTYTLLFFMRVQGWRKSK